MNTVIFGELLQQIETLFWFFLLNVAASACKAKYHEGRPFFCSLADQEGRADNQ
jgi:hypothetical protein